MFLAKHTWTLFAIWNWWSNRHVLGILFKWTIELLAYLLSFFSSKVRLHREPNKYSFISQSSKLIFFLRYTRYMPVFSSLPRQQTVCMRLWNKAIPTGPHMRWYFEDRTFSAIYENGKGLLEYFVSSSNSEVSDITHFCYGSASNRISERF